MLRTLPLLKQERDDTCALACLRMILASRGMMVAETDLVRRATLLEGGVDIQELERLARTFGLNAAVQDVSVQRIRAFLHEGTEVIAYINRSVFDLLRLSDLTPALHTRRIHAVVPIRVTARSITFHDPRLPAVSTKTIRRFEAAQRHVQSACVILAGSLSPEQ